MAAMVFNGHTQEYIETIDEELFTEIQVMYADGVIGNKGVFDALAPITAAVFNYFRPQGASAFKVDQIFPWVQEYSVNPDTEMTPEQAASNGLLVFMSQAPGFEMTRFQNGN